MQGPDLDLLATAARKAGKIALGYFQDDPRVWDKDDNAGPVTEADLAVNTKWESFLGDARPDYGWLSEESENDPKRLDCECVFILDPIDGTRAFIEGSAHWSHSLAIARNGIIETAAVYLPVKDLMYTAQRGKGAFLNGDPIAVSPRIETKGATILATKANFDPKFWPGGFPGIERHFRSSLAYRLCLVAQGKYDGMITLRPTWEWDVAAGQLIVEEAGGTVTTQHDTPSRYNNADPRLAGLVAAGPQVHRGLMQGLTAPMTE